jgi:hypothetical protein
MYYGQNGKQGNEVWGTRNAWVRLSGTKNSEKISVILMDHPSNPGFPAHFHARGYGLFSINNLGQKVFNPEEPEQNFTLKQGESLHFTHRMIIASGAEISTKNTDGLYQEFISSGQN